MPLFDFQCTGCGIIQERYEKDRQVPVTCDTCGAPMKSKYTSFSFSMDFKPGFDYGLGKYVTSKKQRENIIAEKGLRRIKD